MKEALLVIVVLLLASVGRTGEVLKWVDERGVVHFTDNAASVPQKYRKGVNRRELSDETEGSSGVTREVKEVGEEPRDRYGRGEDHWTKKANEAKEALDQAQREYERVRLEYNGLIAKYNATRSRAKRRQYQKRIESLQGQLNRRREDIERARELLQKALPQEAEKAGAPVQWVK